jgi:hypothetical protein
MNTFTALGSAAVSADLAYRRELLDGRHVRRPRRVRRAGH